MYKHFAFAIIAASTYSFMYTSESKDGVEKCMRCNENSCCKNNDKKLSKPATHVAQENPQNSFVEVVLSNPHFATRSPLESMYYNKRYEKRSKL